VTETVTEPTGVAQVLTPSGIEVYYQSGPKRLYRIRNTQECGCTATPFLWQEVPSVSTVLGVLDKPALVWWGQRIGVSGAINVLHEAPEAWSKRAIELDHDSFVAAIVDELKERKLTVNHQRDKAADRGTNVHSALESWAETGITPDPRFFPENERGYVQGLVNFINDAHPHPLQSEVMVASLDGFAGRFDLLANLDFAGKVVTKTYPKKEDIRSDISGAWLLDLKTSKDVYPSYHLQLAAYMRGLGECGYGLPEHAGVVRVTDDGRYELVECRAIYEDFKRVLDAYNSIERIKGK
jgi:hypothetical protein